MERQRGGLVWRVTRGTFAHDAEEPLSLDELLALLGSVGRATGVAQGRHRLLPRPASEGWQDAVRRLGGAFAEEAAGLKERKDGLTGRLTSAFQNVFKRARIKQHHSVND